MTMSSSDRRRQKYAPIFDVDPVTGRSIEVFYADRTLESFGWEGAGWFWLPRCRGFAAYGPAVGPFPTSYSAYRDALRSRTDPRQFGERSPGFRLCADRAGGCMRQGAAEQIASEAARAAARAEPDSVQNLLEYQLLVATTGGEGEIRTHDTEVRVVFGLGSRTVADHFSSTRNPQAKTDPSRRLNRDGE
jgi:hypothetical protein